MRHQVKALLKRPTMPTPANYTPALPTSSKQFYFQDLYVRIVMLGELPEPWFVATDVCEALTISNVSDAVGRLDDDERGVGTVDTPGGAQEQTIINESGLYSLILTSRKPAAKAFKKWVTSEVLPSIRKTGSYLADNTFPTTAARKTAEDSLAMASLLGVPTHLAQIEAIKHARLSTGVDFSYLLHHAPAQNSVADDEVMLEPTELGKHLGLSAVAVNRKLEAVGLQTRDHAGCWQPTAKGAPISFRHSWTSKGKSGYNLKWKLQAVKSLLASH